MNKVGSTSGKLDSINFVFIENIALSDKRQLHFREVNYDIKKSKHI